MVNTYQQTSSPIEFPLSAYFLTRLGSDRNSRSENGFICNKELRTLDCTILVLTMESQKSLNLEAPSSPGLGHSGAVQEPLNTRRVPTGTHSGLLEFASFGSGKKIPQRNDFL